MFSFLCKKSTLQFQGILVLTILDHITMIFFTVGEWMLNAQNYNCFNFVHLAKRLNHVFIDNLECNFIFTTELFSHCSTFSLASFEILKIIASETSSKVVLIGKSLSSRKLWIFPFIQNCKLLRDNFQNISHDFCALLWNGSF